MFRRLAVLMILSVALLSACAPETTTTGTGSGDQQITASGLKYVILEQGTGVQAKPGDTVTVKYTGKLQDGTVFDSGDYTFVLGAGEVIPGWDEGIALLNEG